MLTLTWPGTHTCEHTHTEKHTAAILVWFSTAKIICKSVSVLRPTYIVCLVSLSRWAEIAWSIQRLGYGLDGSGVVFRQGKIFLFAPKDPDRLWATHNLIFSAYWCYFLGQSGREVKLTTRLHPVPRLRMFGATPWIPLDAFVTSQETLRFVASAFSFCLWQLGNIILIFPNPCVIINIF